MAAYTLEQRKDLVRSGVYRVTDEQVEAIALRCMEANECNENASVWHQAALYFGTRCNCAQCRPAS